MSAEVVARKDSDTRGGSLSNPFLLIRTREFVAGTSKCVSFPNIQGKRSQIYQTKRPCLVHIILYSNENLFWVLDVFRVGDLKETSEPSRSHIPLKPRFLFLWQLRQLKSAGPASRYISLSQYFLLHLCPAPPLYLQVHLSCPHFSFQIILTQKHIFFERKH